MIKSWWTQSIKIQSIILITSNNIPFKSQIYQLNQVSNTWIMNHRQSNSNANSITNYNQVNQI